MQVANEMWGLKIPVADQGKWEWNRNSRKLEMLTEESMIKRKRTRSGKGKEAEQPILSEEEASPATRVPRTHSQKKPVDGGDSEDELYASDDAELSSPLERRGVADMVARFTRVKKAHERRYPKLAPVLAKNNCHTPEASVAWLVLNCSGQPLPGSGSAKMPLAAKYLASWLFIKKDSVPFLRTSGVEGFLDKQQTALGDAAEPQNIIRCARKIFALIVDAHKRSATPATLDFGMEGGAGRSEGPRLDFGGMVSTVPPPPQSALQVDAEASAKERSAFYTAKFPPRIGGIGESAASRFALRYAALEVKRASLQYALPAEAQAEAEQPSLLVRHSDSCRRGNGFMRSAAELAQGIRTVERQLLTAQLRDFVRSDAADSDENHAGAAAASDESDDPRILSTIYQGSMLRKPLLVHGYQYGLPQGACDDPIGWRMQAVFPTSVRRGTGTELRFHAGFVFDQR